MKKLIVLFLLNVAHLSVAQVIEKIEPPTWWVGMKDSVVQLMIYGKDIGNYDVSVAYPGVSVNQLHRPPNKNYLFVDMIINAQTKPGTLDLTFQSQRKRAMKHKYVLNARASKAYEKGLTQSDVIYLVMPDRFVNANPENDNVKSLKEKANRSFHGGRHGGDIQGIMSKIDYLKELGITSLWINPLLENDMPEYSYHGYATTDYYNIDARYGTNEDYRRLSEELQRRGMKLIMDMVFNHCGSEHWWLKDMPFPDWIHHFPKFVDTNHAISALSDPYAAESDINQMETGWFVSAMPDLNHDNPFMANYLIQNSIWWIEFAELKGIRMDTYPYNKKAFMVEWAKKIYDEYPGFYIVGETWVDNVAQESYWSMQQPQTQAFNSHLNSITDFPLCFAIHKAFAPEGDVRQLYDVISKDFLYYKPSSNKIFADNHDMDRVYHTLGQDVDKLKLAMTFLFTTRGIPQLFYGTEILMAGHGEHGVLRQDFPGGWPGDDRDAFSRAGRTERENSTYDFLANILKWRKTSDAIARGNLLHFVPYENLYVYNRKSEKESVLVMINNSREDRTIVMDRYAEVLKGYTTATDIISGSKLNDLNRIDIKGNSSLILVLSNELRAD